MHNKTFFLFSFTALVGTLFYYGNIIKTAHSEVVQSPPDMCGKYWGEPEASQGTGACAGNVSLSISLGDLYPGLALNYNSTGVWNPSGFGKNWTLSEVTFVNNSASPTFILGNQRVIPLQKMASGKWSGKWLAKNRELLADHFANPTATTFQQKSMEGETYNYVVQAGTLFRISEALNRYGEKTTINVGVGLASENITYSDGKVVTISRSSGSVVFTRNTVTVTLTLDAFSRLTRIESSEGEWHSFTYQGDTEANNTPLLLSHSWSERASGPTFTHYYSYDANGKLLTLVNEKGGATTFLRNFSTRTVETRSWNGQVHVETFNADKRLVSEKVYVVGKSGSPISGATYEHNANGTVGKVILPQQTTEYFYDATDPMLLIGENVTENGTLTRKITYTRSLDSYLTSRTTVRRGDDSMVSDTVTTLPTAIPYIPSKIQDAVTGSYQTFAYSGATTTIKYYDKNATLSQTEVFDKRNLRTRTNHLAPTASQTQSYTYGTGDRVATVVFEGKTTSFGYDSEGRQNYVKYPNGREDRTTYDSNSYVTEETKTYPTGLSEKYTYTNTLHSDGSIAVQTITKEVRKADGQLASGLGEVREVEYSNRASGHKVLVTRLNGVENYRK